jgi:pyruvate/2-oxoglutarate dehydrogenase complex dihydrolipoamide acyltransferase (E2) component
MFTSLTSGNRKWWSLAGGGVLLIAAAAAWGVTAHFRPAKDPLGLPPELSAENLRARAANPETLMQTMHETMQRTDLSDAQREEVMHRMRGVWQARLDQRINEYFAAVAAEEKQAVLDRQLDEMQQEMKEREARRAEMERDRAQRDGQGDRPHRPDFASQSPQEQKTRAESRDPDAMARRMAYFQALRARATERGIQMPFGPGGGRGGPPGRGGPH